MFRQLKSVDDPNQDGKLGRCGLTPKYDCAGTSIQVLGDHTSSLL